MVMNDKEDRLVTIKHQSQHSKHKLAIIQGELHDANSRQFSKASATVELFERPIEPVV